MVRWHVPCSFSNQANQIAFHQNAEGTALAPFDCWLFLRGIKTMAIRMDRAQDNAIKIARLLQAHPSVTQVFYPGLESHESRDIHHSQCLGPGCVMSFTTGNLRLSQRFIDACRIFKLTVSFGSVHSLCEMPCTMSHASIPGEERTLPDDLIRLSIGIEDAEDLMADIRQSLELGEIPPFPALPPPFWRSFPPFPPPFGVPLRRLHGRLPPTRNPPHRLTAESSIPDLRKFKEAEQLLYDSQFQDRDVVPALPAKL